MMARFRIARGMAKFLKSRALYVKMVLFPCRSIPMDKALLSKTAAAMVAKGKGLLAADESSGTCETRFKSVGVECTEENRRAYRGLLFTTPGIEQFLSGVILFDETLRQKTNDGVPFGDYLAKKGI